MKYLIMGRSGSGKDTMAKELENRGLSLLKTYTTRPPRGKNDTQHHYVSEEQADALPDRFTEMTINGYRYFVTDEQFKTDAPDIIVIEPIGAKELVDRFPETNFQIIHMIAPDADQKRQKAIDRADDTVAEAIIYEQKIKDEDRLFLDFEEKAKTGDPFAENAATIFNIKNDYQIETIQKYAKQFVNNKQLFTNIVEIINQCVALGILVNDKNSHIVTTVRNGTNNETKQKNMTQENFADCLLSDPKGLDMILSTWLAQPLNLKGVIS